MGSLNTYFIKKITFRFLLGKQYCLFLIGFCEDDLIIKTAIMESFSELKTPVVHKKVPVWPI